MQEILGEELIDCWSSKIKRENRQHQMLHSQHLLFCVGVVSDVNKFCYLRGVDLLKLPTVKQRSVSMENKLCSLRLECKDTYEARSIAAVPTSCSFPLRTDMEDKKRSM